MHSKLCLIVSFPPFMTTAMLYHARSLAAALGCLLPLALLPSCASTSPSNAKKGQTEITTPPEVPPSYSWDEEKAKAPGGARIKIGLAQQRATFYKGNTVVGWTTIASGIDRFPTPTGSFKILEKVVDKKSNLYGRIYNASGGVVNSDAKAGRDPIPAGGRFEGSQMKYWMRLTSSGVGMHIGPHPRPGFRASHGCIRLPAYIAEQFYKNTSLGTPVTVASSDGGEPLSKARLEYEEKLAAYTKWVEHKWDEHNARAAKSPEARKAAKAKLKAEREAQKLAERAAKNQPAAAATPVSSPAPEARRAEPVADTNAAPAAGQTVFLDPQNT
jgi:hypothetical protein